MKLILIISFTSLFLLACCPELPTQKAVQTDSVYIERIVRDTIYLDDAPEIKVIDDSKTFTVNPFEAVTDTVIANKHKLTHIKAKFTMTKQDSSNFNINVSDITGDISRTITKTKTITLTKVIKENIKWYEYFIWISIGFFIGIVALMLVMVLK